PYRALVAAFAIPGKLAAVALVATLAVHPLARLVRPRLSWRRAGLTNGDVVIEVIRRLREQKQLLVGLRDPVMNALTHRVRLVPDDFAAKVPASLTQG